MAYINPEVLRTEFTKAGYGELAQVLIANARHAVSVSRLSTDDESAPLGCSKLGGRPDLPSGAEWPTRGGRPLAFLAQFALADVPHAEGEPLLPNRGLLSFFYDTVEQPWGFDPEDRDGWRVLYWESPGQLDRVDPPKGAFGEQDDPEYDRPFQACLPSFTLVTTYPEMGNGIYAREDAQKLLTLYRETLHAGQSEETPHHQFFGHPLVVQNPMEEECQLVSHGIYCGDELSDEDEARAQQLREGAKDWVLLLQLDTDDEVQWMWGDMGILYFWIRRQDLEARAFERAWCVLQCG